ncbi:MAG: DUF6785 family protein [Armatimonadota bacterium]
MTNGNTPTTSSIRWKMVIPLGIILTTLNVIWMAYMQMVWNQGYSTILSLLYNVVFTIVLLVMVNNIVWRIRQSAALTVGELLLIFVMTTVGSSIAMQAEYMMSMLAFPYQFTNLDSRWTTTLLPHLPKMLTVSDPQSTKDYYLGNASLLKWISLKPWLIPLAGWGVFFVALVWTGISLSALFFDHWRHQERLPFPINQIPLAIVERNTRFYQSKAFWIAFAIAGGINILNALHNIYPSVPQLWVKRQIINIDGLSRPWSALSPIVYSLNPILIGLEYFLPVDLLFSVFFFYWIGRLQGVVFSAFGVEGLSQAEMVAPYVREQAFGALIALLVFSFWASKGTWRESWTRAGSILPQKKAVYGAISGMTVMLLVLLFAGMPIHIAVLFVLIIIVLSVSLARIRAQYGPPGTGLLLAAPGPILYNLFGRDMIGIPGLSSIALTHWMGREFAGHPMLPTLEGMALTEQRVKPGLIITCIMVSAIVGYMAACGTALFTGYHLGHATAKTGGTQMYFGMEAYNIFSSRLNDRTAGLHAGPTVAAVAGMLVTLALQVLRTRFAGFALHPVGYAVSSTYVSTYIWSTAFITWVFKLLLLRYAGLKGYYAAAPFFLGLLLGDCMIGSLISLIGVCLHTNLYVFWPY